MNAQPSRNLELFYSEFLNAHTWEQYKEGVPLELLDHLSADELKIAEGELLRVVSLNDSWPIRGLGHIKSSASLPKLRQLLADSSGYLRIALAHAIFSICADNEMIEIAIRETSLLEKKLPDTELQMIDTIYLLPDFHDVRITKILSDLCQNENYFVAYNAARVSGKVTDDFRRTF